MEAAEEGREQVGRRRRSPAEGQGAPLEPLQGQGRVSPFLQAPERVLDVDAEHLAELLRNVKQGRFPAPREVNQRVPKP